MTLFVPLSDRKKDSLRKELSTLNEEIKVYDKTRQVLYERKLEVQHQLWRCFSRRE